MTSFIQIESVWRQHSEVEDPIAFSFLFPQFAVPVNLLYPHHFKIFHGVVRLAEVGHNWLFFLVLISKRCPFIRACRAFSVSPTYCRPHFLHVIRYTRLLVLHVLLLLMLYCLPVIWLLNVLHIAVSWQHLHHLLLHLLLSVSVGGNWCGQGRADKEVPQILRPSKGSLVPSLFFARGGEN